MHEALRSIPSTVETRPGGSVPVLPVLRRWSQEDQELKVNLRYIVI